MKTVSAISLLLVLFVSALHAQQSNMMQTTRDAINFKGLAIPPNGVMTMFGIKGEQGNLVGDPYMDANWQTGSVKLYRKIGPPGREGDSISNIPMRYDLYNNELEIKVNDGKDVRVIGADLLATFSVNALSNRVFINAREFKSQEPVNGFLEILATGSRLALFEHQKLTIIKPSYNEALNTGNKDTKITKNTQYYYLRGSTIYRLNTQKKKLLEAMPDRADDIEAFIKVNNLNLKNRSDLAKIIDYYNSL